jgi:cytochrome c-type biogenesis protein CcmH
MRHLLFLFFLSLFVFSANSNENKPIDIQTEQRIRQLSEKLRCLVCQNQSLADSNAELAQDLRQQLREQVAAGRSDDQILDYLVQRYGDFVLYDPPFKTITLLLWIGPFVLLAAAALVLVATLRRRRRAPEEPALAPEDKRLVERVLGPAAPPRERDGSAR